MNKSKRKAPTDEKAVGSKYRHPKRKPPPKAKAVAADDSSDDENCDSSGDEGSLAYYLASISLSLEDEEVEEFQLPDTITSLSLEADAKTADAKTVDDYDTLTQKEMQALCVTKGLSKTGTKDVMRARLQLHDTIGLDWSRTDVSTPPPPFTRSHGPAHLLKRGRPLSAAPDPYRGRPGPLCEIDYFQMLVTSEIIDLLVTETVRYARQHGDEDFTTDEAEMKAFIGLMIWQGWKRLPQTAMYFSRDEMVGVPAISKHWTRARLRAYHRYFHVSDNRTAHCQDTLCQDSQHDKLHKLTPFLKLVSTSCLAAWAPRQDNVVDEVIVRFKGQTRMKSYIKTKKHKWGIKLWKACDSSSDYMWAFSIYTGADDSTVVSSQGVPYSLGEKVVLYFAKLLEAGHPWIFYLDNFFTSVRLLVDLKSQYGIYATGTVNIWSRMFPRPLAAQYTRIKRSPRGTYEWVMSKPGILVVTWNDTAPNATKKAVSFASTVSGPGSAGTVDRWVRRAPEPTQVVQPEVAQEYSSKMGGVDRNNRGAEMYRISRKTKKWWWAVFWHIMDSLIHNAWVLMYPDGADNVRKKQQLQFRINLAKQLIGDFSCRQRMGPKIVHPAPVVQHWPERRPDQERCACKCGKKTKFGCATCGVPLVIECFATYHNGSH